MVFVDINPSLGTAAEICTRLKDLGVLALPSGPQRVRMVTHLDVTKADMDSTITAFERITGRHQPGVRRTAEPTAASRRAAAMRSR
jgi:acetylornithine/succinyldiaminopimelate/putrescine aminotransferase